MVTEPNGVQRSRPITLRGLTIGRGDENDLVLNYGAASRSHALVTFNQGRYYVIDLGSANGTYLGDARLDPNLPTLWTPGQPLRIGEVLIRLQVQQMQAQDAGSETFVGWRPEAGPAPAKRPGWGQAARWILVALAIALILAALLIAATRFL